MLLRPSGLVLLLAVTACADRPPHVVLRIEDPEEIAVGFDRLEVGTSLESLKRVKVSSGEFPLSITVTASTTGEQDVWAQVADANGAMARGFTRARFAKKGTPTAAIVLARACSDASACDDGVYCNGMETCTDGRCSAGSDPCGASFACVVSTCLEGAGGVGDCDVSVSHAECGAGSYCDPMAGCIPGESCLVDADCQDSSYCNGAEVCAGFHCAPGDLPNVDDEDDCTIDGCNDASSPPQIHVPDPSQDGSACTRPAGAGAGICIAAQDGCVESLCGDGFVDPAQEDCDDGPDNPNDGCDACQHTRWVPELVIGRGPAGGDPLQLDLRFPQGVAVDQNGRIFVADSSRYQVWLLDPSGAVTVAAGTGVPGDAGDGGPAAQAHLSAQGVAVDRAGNLYVSDVVAQRVRKVCFDPAGCGAMSLGEIATVAGKGAGGFSGDDGPAILAQLDGPQSVAIDGRGNLYIADTNNSRVRQVCLDEAGCLGGLPYGYITTVAGDDQNAELVDDVLATEASLALPLGVAVDGAGNLFISDTQHSAVRLVCRRLEGCAGLPFGYIGRVAGDGEFFTPLGDGGPAEEAGLLYPAGLSLDPNGNLLIADMAHSRVRFVCRQPGGCGSLPEGYIDTVAGGGSEFLNHVPAVTTELVSPWHAAFEPNGNIVVGDNGHQCLRRICRQAAGCGALTFGDIVTIAGGSSVSAIDGTPATSAPLQTVYGIAVDGNDNLYVGTGTNNTVFRVCRAAAGCGAIGYGEMETIVGNGDFDPSGDGGLALEAGLGTPADVHLDALGNLYVSQQTDRSVRMVCTQPTGCGALGVGEVDTIAGGGSNDPIAGGPATEVSLTSLNDIHVHGDELLLLTGGVVLRVCLSSTDCGGLASGHIELVAGGGSGPDIGDGGPPDQAWLSQVRGAVTDELGNIYVTDNGHQRVRRICRAAGGCDGDAAGTINTIAGGGVEPPGGGGLATDAALNAVIDLALTPDGLLVISDEGDEQLHAVCLEPAGCGPIRAKTIVTIAGTGEVAVFGDGGPAIDAGIRAGKIASDSAGNLYLSFSVSPRVRFICRDPGGCGEVATGEIVSVGGPVFPEGDGTFSRGALGTPMEMIWLDDQRLLVADGASGRLRLADFASERVTTVVGHPTGFLRRSAPFDRARYVDLLGTAVGLVDLTVGAERQVWFSELSFHDVLSLNLVDADAPLTWTVNNLQEVGSTPGHVDGTLSNALFVGPAGMVFDPVRRNIYVADSGNHAIREIDVDAGMIATIAGSPDAQGYYGDGVDAATAVFNRPTALSFWPPDHLYIADTDNHRVRCLDLNSLVVEDVLGDGTPSASGTGMPARHFPVYEPAGLALDRFGNLFVSSRYAVREVLAGADSLASADDAVTTIYGAPPRDGPPESATICLTGLSFVPGTADDGELLALDACQGYLVRLTRSAE